MVCGFQQDKCSNINIIIDKAENCAKGSLQHNKKESNHERLLRRLKKLIDNGKISKHTHTNQMNTRKL